jgi:hypothetical protein
VRYLIGRIESNRKLYPAVRGHLMPFAIAPGRHSSDRFAQPADPLVPGFALRRGSQRIKLLRDEIHEYPRPSWDAPPESVQHLYGDRPQRHVRQDKPQSLCVDIGLDRCT